MKKNDDTSRDEVGGDFKTATLGWFYSLENSETSEANAILLQI